MFWILHGEDEFRRSEFLASLKRDLGDPTMLDVNTTVLDGRRVTLRGITNACDTIPFLGDNRLVIVNDLLANLQGGGKRTKGVKKGSEAESVPLQDEADSPRTSLLKELQDYLRRLPDTTLLIFVESTQLDPKHPLRSLTREDPDRGRIQEFRSFSTYGRDGPGHLARWIKERMQEKKLELTPDAIQVLVMYVGYDLRLMDQELDKLSAFANGQRTVSGADVRLMVSAVREADIFEMVDALGRRDVRRATMLLHQMLDEGKAPLYLLTMIVRQFRIMIQTKELSSLGFSATETARQLRLHEFVVKKCLEQARSVSIDQLCEIYFSLAEYDAAIKTGRISETLALDLLISEAWAGQA